MTSPHRRLLLAGRGSSAPLAVAVGVGVASAVLAVAQAALLARSIAGAVQGGLGPADLAVPLGALLVVLVARALLGWASEGVAQRISGRVKAQLRLALVEHAVRLGPRWAATTSSGGLVLLATRGLDALDGYYGRYLPSLGLAVVVPPVVVLCLLGADVIAALTVGLTVPLIPVFMVLIGRMSADRRTHRWASLSLLAHRFADVVGGLPTLRAFGRADAQVGILREITHRYRTSTMATLRVAFLSALALELLATISIALVALGIGLRLVNGTLTLEVGLFALVLAPEAYLPLRRLGAEFHASEEGVTAATQAFGIIDAPVDDPEDGIVPAGAITRLRVEDVSVGQPGRDVLAPAGASLEARRGEVVAITGPSGAGKSTLLAVLLRLVAPDVGAVRVTTADGEVDLADIGVAAWRALVAWVPQSPWLFAGTVAENVRLGTEAASDGAVREALDAVGLPDLALEAPLGEHGRGLSSGQRRRVGIARALVHRGSIVLLDEPTAGLDADAEATVLRAIRGEAERGAIVLVVTHRPGAIGGADRVVTVGWRATAP